MRYKEGFTKPDLDAIWEACRRDLGANPLYGAAAHPFIGALVLLSKKTWERGCHTAPEGAGQLSTYFYKWTWSMAIKRRSTRVVGFR